MAAAAELFTSRLYHDIAGRGGDHSRSAVWRVASAGVSGMHDDVELVAWLGHLRLSKTAQHYDLTDPQVIADFARFVGDRERLVYLFVLTVADVTAVGPGTWTDWKGHLFSQLYPATDAWLRSGRVSPEEQRERIAKRKESVVASPTRERPAITRLWTPSRSITLNLPMLLTLCRLLVRDSGVAGRQRIARTPRYSSGGAIVQLSALTATLANAIPRCDRAAALRDGHRRFITDQRQPVRGDRSDASANASTRRG